MSSVRFDIEKFDGKINFGLWQVQLKDVLIQFGIYKALKGKPSPDPSKDTTKMEEAWEDLDLRAASAIRLCLAKNVLANVQGIFTAKELWEKLEELYQAKGVSNRVYLKEQFHTLHMNEGTTISDHLSVLNGIVFELETIGVKIDDEDMALWLIWSLPTSYEHMKPILIHGKEKIIFSEVTGNIFSEEKRLSSGTNIPPDDAALLAENWKRITSKRKVVVCWGSGQSGHLKRHCPKTGGAAPTCGSRSNANGDANSMSLCSIEDYSDAL